jgi:hypothetical protein
VETFKSLFRTSLIAVLDLQTDGSEVGDITVFELNIAGRLARNTLEVVSDAVVMSIMLKVRMRMMTKCVD